MNHLLESITNASTRIDGYSYDRTPFYAGNAWNRSLLSGAISTSLTAIGVYTGYLAMDASFASALGAQALDFKLACGAVIASLLGYSLRDLFRSITSDVKTQMRVARANCWLAKGAADTADESSDVQMQQLPLTMVRFVEVDGGIKVYCIARQDGRDQLALIEAVLLDDEHQAYATIHTEPAEIRIMLHEACGNWSNAVASQMGISLGQRTEKHLSGATRLPPPQVEEELVFDDDFLDDFKVGSDKVYGQASAPRRRTQTARPETLDTAQAAVTH